MTVGFDKASARRIVRATLKVERGGRGSAGYQYGRDFGGGGAWPGIIVLCGRIFYDSVSFSGEPREDWTLIGGRPEDPEEADPKWLILDYDNLSVYFSSDDEPPEGRFIDALPFALLSGMIVIPFINHEPEAPA